MHSLYKETFVSDHRSDMQPSPSDSGLEKLIHVICDEVVEGSKHMKK